MSISWNMSFINIRYFKKEREQKKNQKSFKNSAFLPIYFNNIWPRGYDSFLRKKEGFER